MPDIESKRAAFKLGSADGAVEAIFSTFGVIDSDADIVLASAFTPGQQVPMVWAHDWQRPVGKGSVRVERDRAVLDGMFFLDTTAGLDAYRTVKAMGDLQEWSWGFRVTDADYGEVDGQSVRYIKGTELYEVSPVLVGANRDTATLAIKGHGLDFDAHADAFGESLEHLIARCRSGSEARAKEGRAISSARRGRMQAVSESLRVAATEIDGLLEETAPPKSAASETLRLRADWERLQARHARAFGATA